ncbi:hypothetical protein RAC89_05740 [Paenibacillus sp. GD4]|jgi:hypothetical protein|nr:MULTISPECIES: hypothetical protein [Paenibacillus]MDQ1909996.1 hypothetical protein [Paenibacillus sp. GD4]
MAKNQEERSVEIPEENEYPDRSVSSIMGRMETPADRIADKEEYVDEP